mgnify:FL=1
MKLSDIITPEKFRELATYLTICDKKLGNPETETEVQDDLCKFADALEDMEAQKGSSNIQKLEHSLIPKEIVDDSGATSVCISINGIQHLNFLKRKYIGLQSWYESKNDFKIEIYLDGAIILLEYNSLEKWQAILKIINEQV